jgi:SOS response regulatory protein OraA/RecX
VDVTRSRLDAFAQGLKLLSGRDKPLARLRVELERREFSASEIDSAVERLLALGYLDDARLAARWAAEALADGWAPEGAVGRLMGRGLDEALARRAIAQATHAAGWREREAAAALLAKRGLSGPRGARLLLSRGFQEDVVRECVGDE